MALALYRVELSDGAVRIARGDSHQGPQEVFDPEVTLTGLMQMSGAAISEATSDLPAHGLDTSVRILSPIEEQDVWAAGVTYRKSRQAREEESAEPDCYARVFTADRPELFFKSKGPRVVGPEEAIGIRADSNWDVPEAELVLALNSDLSIVAFTIGNDVSSRQIEGENPLYLPQAKVYERSCALGPCLVLNDAVSPPFDIGLRVTRGDRTPVEISGSTSEMQRSLGGLASYLGRALSFPQGVFLMTGTNLVPTPDFTLRDGDQVEISIGGLGELRNPVVTVGEPSTS